MAARLLRAAALCLALSLGAAQPAWAADDWAPAFPDDAVASHFPGKALKLVVVAAGEAGEDRDAALSALTAAVEAAETVDLVMDAGALGDVAALDDAAIVGKAQALPVDRVVVLRVFPAKSGSTAAVSAPRSIVKCPAGSSTSHRPGSRRVARKSSNSS